MADWQVVGRQRVRVVDDLVHWEVLADVNVPELRQILETCGGVQAAHGYALLLITSSTPGAYTFPPEARKFLAQFHREHQAVGATAVVGASATMTIIVDLVLRAVAMVSGHRPNTRFFHSREDAVSWLMERGVLGKKGLLTHK